MDLSTFFRSVAKAVFPEAKIVADNIIGESVSNGFIEGSNNKIKVLKRISYDVRNFERFRNRILYLQ